MTNRIPEEFFENIVRTLSSDCLLDFVNGKRGFDEEYREKGAAWVKEELALRQVEGCSFSLTGTLGRDTVCSWQHGEEA